MYRLIAIFRSETTYYYNSININVRRIVLSNIFKTISSQLVTTFLNAFIWRITDSLISVAIYNIGMVVSLPMAFYLNGLLLKHTHIQKLLAWGAIASGITSTAFVFFGNSNIFAVFLYGCVWGFGNGFYWANRNYLELKETFSEVRLYFYGILQSISSIASIFIPLLAGWFIIFGSFSHFYSIKTAYWILFAFSFVLMFLCGRVISHGTFESPVLENILVKKIFVLNKRRILNIASGFIDGTPFVSTLLILIFLGNEGVLGTITAIVSVVVAIITYIYGKKAKPNSGIKTVFMSGFLFLISGFCLILFPIKSGIISYVLLLGIATNFFSMSITPVVLSLVEKEMKDNINSRYSFIFDNELFLNIGRLISLLIIISLFLWVPENIVLTYSPVLIGIVFMLILALSFFIKNKEKI